MNFFVWLQEFVTWLRGRVGTDEPKPLYKARFTSGDLKTTLLLLPDESSDFPGVVAAWHLNNEDAENNYIFLLCNLAQIREAIAREPATTIRDPKRVFEIRARAEMQSQRNIAGSHLLMIGSISKEPVRSDFVNSKIQRFHHLDFVKCAVVNLQRETWQVRDLGANDDAEKILKTMMLRALKLEADEQFSWESLFWGVDWIDWMKFFADARFGRSHILQPPRATGKPKGFTIIELLVVVLVVGILAAIAYPSYLSKIQEAHKGHAISLMRSLATERQTYATEAGSYPPDQNRGIPPAGLEAQWDATVNELPYGLLDYENWQDEGIVQLTWYGANNRRDSQVYTLEVDGDDAVVRIYVRPEG